MKHFLFTDLSFIESVGECGKIKYLSMYTKVCTVYIHIMDLLESVVKSSTYLCILKYVQYIYTLWGY